MKLKKYAKGLAKDAATHCAIRHREVRAYLREQVKALAALIGVEPGMLGPKLPMVRFEVCSYDTIFMLLVLLVTTCLLIGRNGAVAALGTQYYVVVIREFFVVVERSCFLGLRLRL